MAPFSITVSYGMDKVFLGRIYRNEIACGELVAALPPEAFSLNKGTYKQTD